MDLYEVYFNDRKKFDEDLAELIESAAAAAASSASSSATTPNTAPTSPPVDPRLRGCKRPSSQEANIIAADPRLRHHKTPAPQHASAKRARLEDPVAEVQAVSADVHPSRVSLLQQPEYARRGSAQELVSPASPIESSALPAEETMTSAVQGTGANTVKLGAQCPSKTWNTLRNTVHRQWDSRRDDMGYEELLENRRAEKLQNVDRYVPSEIRPSSRCRTIPPPRSRSMPFRFVDLPDKIQKKIMSLLLVKAKPIEIDFSWLRPFVKGHCRVPSAIKTIQDKDSVYSIPLGWDELTTAVGVMQKDCAPFKEALEVRGNKTRKLKGPCRGLTTGVLFVSKGMHKLAASVLYGENTWSFPWASSSWIQLESFLATIGPMNVAFLRKIDIHVPLWHQGAYEDFIEGAVLDLTSPASRLGVLKPVGRDRLLGAIRSSVHSLMKAGQLETLSINIENGTTLDRWTGRSRDDKQLLNVSDAEEHVIRKQEGTALVKKLSDCLRPPPVLSIYQPSAKSKIAKHDVSLFRARLATVIREAEKYGWKVNQRLESRRW
ncbi:Hypothetical predicted protein [Lecanosticta acicola]|uniref:Uncharacterized protein n=1 Tax=Lecanosticta acicola TaxID=111012 RepID=A0AAI8YZL5_9PEZI|nr:Hypothetical predicted protein [Lecanosticta acicola]